MGTAVAPMNPGATLLLTTWLVAVVALGLPVVAAYLLFRRSPHATERTRVAGSFIVLGFLAYATFFGFFVHAYLGIAFACGITAASLVILYRCMKGEIKARGPAGDGSAIGLIFAGFSLFYLGLLYLPTLPHGYMVQSAFRFVHELPLDPVLPAIMGDRLMAGESLRPFAGDWLSSDRPPLQTGFYLLVLPWMRAAHLPTELGYQCVGTLAQMLWVPAVWLLCRALAQTRRHALLSLLIVGTAGFTILNSTYVWPKLLAASYVIFAALFLLQPERAKPLAGAIFIGGSAALGWLSHGAAAFSFLALVPIWLVGGGASRRTVLSAALVFIVVTLPWTAYQKIYDPPGDRLLKWHLAGVKPIDSASAFQDIRSAYAQVSWQSWIDGRKLNLHMVRDGSFESVINVFTTPAKARRYDEFFFFFRAIGILNLAWLVWPILAWYRRGRAWKFPLGGKLASWILITLTLWIVVMFIPGSTLLHQGSYAAPLVAFTLASALLLQAPAVVRIPLLGWHVVYFATTWLPYFGNAPLNLSMVAVFAIAGFLALWSLKIIWENDPSELSMAGGNSGIKFSLPPGRSQSRTEK